LDIISNGVRDIDTCARYSGEEFIILLPNTDEYVSGVLAERLRKAIEQCIFTAPNNDIVSITCSFGVAQENSRNRVCYWSEIPMALDENA